MCLASSRVALTLSQKTTSWFKCVSCRQYLKESRRREVTFSSIKRCLRDHKTHGRFRHMILWPKGLRNGYNSLRSSIGKFRRRRWLFISKEGRGRSRHSECQSIWGTLALFEEDLLSPRTRYQIRFLSLSNVGQAVVCPEPHSWP